MASNDSKPLNVKLEKVTAKVKAVAIVPDGQNTAGTVSKDVLQAVGEGLNKNVSQGLEHNKELAKGLKKGNELKAQQTQAPTQPAPTGPRPGGRRTEEEDDTDGHAE